MSDEIKVGDLVKWEWWESGEILWIIGLIYKVYNVDWEEHYNPPRRSDIIILSSSKFSEYYRYESGAKSEGWELYETGLSAEHFYKKIKKVA